MRAGLRGLVPRRWRPALKRLYWRGSRHQCPVCESRVRRYLPEGYDVSLIRELDVVGGESWPERTCPICYANTRSRLVWFHLVFESGILDTPTRLLHLAPEMGLYWRLSRAPQVDYHPGDLQPDRYAFADDVRSLDLHSLPYDDASFDAVLANHVLEHVADDARALAEIHRVLRPGGWAMLQVPLARRLETTREDARLVTPEERERALGQSDHVRLYGRDYPERLRRAGFSVRTFDSHLHRGQNFQKRWLLNPREQIMLAIRSE